MGILLFLIVVVVVPLIFVCCVFFCLDLSLPLSLSLFLFLSVSSRDLWGHIAVHKVFFFSQSVAVLKDSAGFDVWYMAL